MVLRSDGWFVNQVKGRRNSGGLES